MIRKNQVVRIKPDWRDPGDETFIWVALNDEEKGRVDIMPTNTGLRFPPIYTVQTEWIDS